MKLFLLSTNDQPPLTDGLPAPNRLFLEDGTEIPNVHKINAELDQPMSVGMHSIPDKPTAYTRVVIELVGPTTIEFVKSAPKKTS